MRTDGIDSDSDRPPSRSVPPPPSPTESSAAIWPSRSAGPGANGGPVRRSRPGGPSPSMPSRSEKRSGRRTGRRAGRPAASPVVVADPEADRPFVAERGRDAVVVGRDRRAVEDARRALEGRDERQLRRLDRPADEDLADRERRDPRRRRVTDPGRRPVAGDSPHQQDEPGDEAADRDREEPDVGGHRPLGEGPADDAAVGGVDRAPDTGAIGSSLSGCTARWGSTTGSLRSQ